MSWVRLGRISACLGYDWVGFQNVLGAIGYDVGMSLVRLGTISKCLGYDWVGYRNVLGTIGYDH